MKASELRIGNYVTHPRNGFDTIKGLDSNIHGDYAIFSNTHEGYYFMHEGHELIEGIPLTEEWLKKLGFKENSFSYVWENKRIGVFDCEILKISHCDIEFLIKHVHQLQNLFYFIEGEELILSS